MLEAKNIRVSYNDKVILEDVSIDVKEKEVVGLLGMSGVGKTTLFNVMSGILVPDKGVVKLNNNDITGKPGEISYMLQKDLLLPFKTVLDNVALPMIIRGEKKSVARNKAEKFFDDFGLNGTQNKYPNELSGGMRQRCALLRTYLCSEGFALLDEPFSALDAITKASIHSWYLSLLEKINLSIIFITHDVDEAITLSDRIYILKGSPGKIAAVLDLPSRASRNKNFNLTNEFLEYKRQILNLI